MPLVRTGRDLIATQLMSTGAAITKKYDSTGAVLFVSSSTDTHGGASTWFSQAAGTPVASTMAAGYPSRSTNVIQFQGSYSTAQANFEWFSWLLHNATQSDTGSPLNFAYSCMGTKVNTQIWTITTCVTLTT